MGVKSKDFMNEKFDFLSRKVELFKCVRPSISLKHYPIRGASINDVHENFEFVDPLPPLSHT